MILDSIQIAIAIGTLAASHLVGASTPNTRTFDLEEAFRGKHHLFVYFEDNGDWTEDVCTLPTHDKLPTVKLNGSPITIHAVTDTQDRFPTGLKLNGTRYVLGCYWTGTDLSDVADTVQIQFFGDEIDMSAHEVISAGTVTATYGAGPPQHDGRTRRPLHSRGDYRYDVGQRRSGRGDDAPRDNEIPWGSPWHFYPGANGWQRTEEDDLLNLPPAGLQTLITDARAAIQLGLAVDGELTEELGLDDQTTLNIVRDFELALDENNELTRKWMPYFIQWAGQYQFATTPHHQPATPLTDAEWNTAGNLFHYVIANACKAEMPHASFGDWSTMANIEGKWDPFNPAEGVKLDVAHFAAAGALRGGLMDFVYIINQVGGNSDETKFGNAAQHFGLYSEEIIRGSGTGAESVHNTWYFLTGSDPTVSVSQDGSDTRLTWPVGKKHFMKTGDWIEILDSELMQDITGFYQVTVINNRVVEIDLTTTETGDAEVDRLGPPSETNWGNIYSACQDTGITHCVITFSARYELVGPFNQQHANNVFDDAMDQVDPRPGYPVSSSGVNWSPADTTPFAPLHTCVADGRLDTYAFTEVGLSSLDLEMPVSDDMIDNGGELTYTLDVPSGSATVQVKVWEGSSVLKTYNHSGVSGQTTFVQANAFDNVSNGNNVVVTFAQMMAVTPVEVRVLEVHAELPN